MLSRGLALVALILLAVAALGPFTGAGAAGSAFRSPAVMAGW